MKTYLFLLLVCFVNTAFGTNYYFSTKYGDDTRTSSQASHSSTPWKTLNKLNAFSTNLQPGDSVLFNRNETFYGSIIVNKSGTASLPIIFGAYGSGNRPIITSFVTLSGWKANSSYSGVYDCAANAALGSELNMVILNEVEQGIGRYPNANADNKGYLIFESHVGYTSITDKNLPSSPNWTGAQLVIRSARWMLDRDLITSQSGSTINYKALSEPRDGYGYFIQNHIKTLDQFGEWYYNPSTKKLSMYFGANNPSSYTIKATSISNLLSSSSKNNLVVDNLTFKGANTENIHIYSGSNIVIQNCGILFSGTDGVNASGTNFRLENCTVLNSNNDGVNVSGADAPVVRNNLVKNSCSIAGMGLSGNGYGVGIKNGRKGFTEYNQVIYSGYNAMSLGGDYSVIKNNFIDSFCLVKDDGAGIYTSNHANITNTGRKILGNIILNAIGAPQGTTAVNFASSAEGIYLDDDANGVEITGNTVANCNRGIYLHNTRNITVKNNTSYNNINGQLYMKHDNLGDPLRNHTITNNIFFSRISTQLASSFLTKDNDLGSIGSLDSNYYARPIDDKTSISNTTYLYTSNQSSIKLDLQGWKSESNLDYSSKKSAKQIRPYTVNSIIGSNKVTNGSFSGNDVSYIGSSATWQNSGVLDGGYAKITPPSAPSSIIFSVGAVSSSKKYLLSFSLKGTSSMSISAYLRGSDYSALAPGQLRMVSTSRTENEMLFTPSKDDSKGSLILSVDLKSSYYLDNIKLYEVDASITNPDDSIRFVYNTTNVKKTVSVDGNYMDVKGSKYSNSITLQPYSSAILIKADGAVSTAPTAPSVTLASPANNSVYSGPATISMSANATDHDGLINKVAFYNGTSLLHIEYKTPYTFSWQNVPVGSYVLTAKATDNSGNVTTSSKVSVSVIDDIAPTVKITSPIVDASFTESANILMSADAIDKDGSIYKVQFYNGNTLLHTEYKAPYSYYQTLPAGSYKIIAKATDNDGLRTTSSSVSITVLSLTSASVMSSSNQLDTSDQTVARRNAGNMSSSVINNDIGKSSTINLSKGDSSKLSDFKLYPNPATNSINLYFDKLQTYQKASIVIQNVSGATLKKFPIVISGKTIQVNISTLPIGVYIINLSTKNFSINKRFIKVK